MKKDTDLRVFVPMEEREWTTDMRNLLLQSSVRRSFASLISTHNCRRGGVQLILDLGYRVSTVMEIGGWDSIESFWYYTRPCNRRNSHFAARSLLWSQLTEMKSVKQFLREELRRSSFSNVAEYARRSRFM